MVLIYMPYVNITLDVGAAINAYKFLWNYPYYSEMLRSIFKTFILW